MEIITTEELMNKLDMFQAVFGKVDEFGWLELEIISANVGTQFTSTEFQEKCQTRGVFITLSALEHQKMKVHEESCVLSHTYLWYMLEFWEIIFILS